MDLYVERQYIEQMKGEDPTKFLLLFDEYFEELYKYVARRVGTNDDAERISRMVFMDALGQIPGTPLEGSYLVWLYGLARPRVWQYMETNKSLQVAVITKEDELEENAELLGKSEKLFSKLSLEEREILRLKFFEEVTDGDVMTIIDSEETSIGSKIYRVLKRAHFLLYGESDERQGVYFGELSGFLERVREIENIELPEMFRGVLRTEISAKLSKNDFAIEVEEVKTPVETPFAVKPTGSNDPAKIFVEAAREMQENDQVEMERKTESFERSEKIFDFIDRWKHVLTLVPIAVFVIVGAIVLVNIFDIFGGGKIARNLPADCEIKVQFDGEFSNTQVANISRGISDKICGHFEEVSSLKIARDGESGKLAVEVDIKDWYLEYSFVKKYENWRIKTYERTISSNNESGEV